MAVFPFHTPGGVGSPLGIPILLGVFGVGALGLAVFVLTGNEAPPVVELCPLLMSALCAYVAWSSYGNEVRAREAIAADLREGMRSERVRAAVERFLSATDVPLRIVVREHLEDPHRSGQRLFEQLRSEGKLDARGVLFVFSVKWAGRSLPGR
ncbi:hypothetical protein HPC49_05945 [Pyxidicoccus fallax]|uniref:Uncharacterized protein n=1 Tax=Pyxidicoccus fallax TaxID=394095 RepID=A0A848LA91_9BACT|nr:hypothetical protein [Pyxidicoccus fallax]NMO15172.1 hypothetical protein [Pyxidicoccus fallax]NPC77794.1 hypothetical protein [Pyxidicoccus fallax]